MRAILSADVACVRKKMRRFARVILLLSSAVLAGCWGSGEATDESSRNDAFREVIGFDRPASVSSVESQYYFMRNSYVRWLRLSCDAETVASIRGIRGAEVERIPETLDSPGDPEKSHNPNAPTRWRDAEMAAGPDELEINRSRTNEMDIVHIWIDKKNHTAYASRTVFN
jgi:hypothetical protein